MMREFDGNVGKDGCTVRIDLASQIIRLDTKETLLGRREELHPTLPSLMGRIYRARPEIEFVSAALLSQKAKQFDDGLVAAIALATQHGLPGLLSKLDCVEGLVAELMQHETRDTKAVIPVLLAAGILGGRIAAAPQQWQAQVDSVLGEFLSDPLRSKPLGFYTWTTELTDIFRQDRMLQTKFSGETLELLAAVMRRQADLRKSYETLLAIGERLTNYYAHADLRKYIAPAGSVKDEETAALFPSCASPETTLTERMFPLPTAVPGDFSLMDEVVHGIRRGTLSLSPSPRSGWYEYQLWSLEPLVNPHKTVESAHLQFDRSYCDHLVNLFKGAYSLARETHVKDLDVAVCGAAGGFRKDPTIYIHPALTVEPTATSYQRRALAYRFICRSLTDLIGDESLRQIHRVSENAPVSQNLGDELRQMEALFWAAYLTSMAELGLPAKLEADASYPPTLDENYCLKHFQNWKTRLLSDPDIANDSRMMVPVFQDLGRKKTKVWVFLGWELTWIEASFVRDPKIEVRDKSGKECKRQISFTRHLYAAPSPVIHEIYVSELLDRPQFRAHCDKYRTTSAILENLA